jgi:hypothetical protein
MWAAIKTARDLGVPGTRLCDETGRAGRRLTGSMVRDPSCRTGG